MDHLYLWVIKALFWCHCRGVKRSWQVEIGKEKLWENFVFATLVFANFAYATLEFDISLLPLLAFDNTSQMPFRGKNDNFRVAIVIHVKS